MSAISTLRRHMRQSSSCISAYLPGPAQRRHMALQIKRKGAIIMETIATCMINANGHAMLIVCSTDVLAGSAAGSNNCFPVFGKAEAACR